MNDTTLPGRGERIAISGYNPQYLTAIYFTLQAMLKRNLTEIRLADLDAWRADDLLVFTHPPHLDAYQMKNEADEISYADFVSSTGETGHLVDLAISWNRLRDAFPTHTLQLHFLTTQHPSTSTHGNVFLPKINHPPSEPSFAAFVREAWQPYQNALQHNLPFSVPAVWNAAFDFWREKSGLSPSEFGSFAKSINIIFGFSFPSLQDVELYARHQDIERLYLHFHSKVGEAKSSHQPIVLSNDDLQILLGRDRFHQRNVHYFKVSDWYTPIEDSVEELQNAIAETESGYLAVVGSPGSGKSSLLTRTLIDAPRDERVVQYYAYLPEERDYASPPRGEAVNFLQDVTQQLDHYGFRADVSLPELNIDTLRAKFSRQLEILANDYRVTHHKTLILLDGLDHISREQTNQIDKSLVGFLPPPLLLPIGVVFVIGTQHLNDFSENIKAHLQEPKRTIHLRTLQFPQMVDLLDKLGLLRELQNAARVSFRNQTAELLQRIFDLSQGHPLAFAYLANQLRIGIHEGKPITEILDSAIPYDGNIYNQYRTHWRHIEDDSRAGLRDVLGMVARLRGAIDFQWLRVTWPERREIQILESRFRHFFRPDRQAHWHFFHNSFRQFLLARSIETIDGSDSLEEERFHSILGDRCLAAIDYPLVQWETVYHYWKAQRYAEASDIATREFFEQQILELRPPDEILNDAQIAAVAAARLYDPMRMFRALFIWSEVIQRNYELEQQDSSLLETLIELGDIEKVLHWLVDGQKLRLRDSLSQLEKVQADTLAFSLRFAKAGYLSEGQELFSIAEPLQYLRAGKPISFERRPEGFELLSLWAQAATLFHTTSDVVGMIRKLEFERAHEESSQSDAAYSRFLQNRLLKSLAGQLISQERWDDTRVAILALAPKTLPQDRLGWFDVMQDFWRSLARKGYVEEARALIREALSVFDLDSLRARVTELRAARSVTHTHATNPDISRDTNTQYESQKNIYTIQQLRIDLGLDLYLILGDPTLADAWTQDIEWKELVDRDKLPSNILGGMENRSLFYSLLVALGKTVPTDSVVVGYDRQLDDTESSLVRIVLVLAQLRGKRWAGDKYSSTAFGQLTASALRAHYAQQYHVRSYLLYDDMTLLLRWLIEEAAQWGETAGTQIQSELEKIWSDDTENRHWKYDLRRQTLLAMLDNNLHPDWVTSQIDSLDDTPITYTENNSHIDEALTRAQICLRLGKNERAKFWLQDAIHASMGVGYVKDYQLSAWIEWLKRRNRLVPEDTASRIQEYAHRVVALKNVEGNGASSAARELLEAALDWHPSIGVLLFWWFFEKECLSFFAAMSDWLEWYVTKAEREINIELGPAVALFNALYLPWTDEEREDPLFKRLLRLLAQRGSPVLEHESKRMLQVIVTETSPKYRQVLVMTLKAVCEEYGVGLQIPDVLELESSQYDQGTSFTGSPILTFTDGRQMTLDTVVANLVKDYRNLDKFIAIERIPDTQSERFRWEDAIKAAIEKIQSVEAIATWANHAEEHGLDKIRLPLAERAMELGAVSLAQELAIAALQGAHEYGWQRNWSEGAKARAYAVLVKANPSDFRKKAFEQLAHDIEDVSSHFSIHFMIQELEFLFPIFASGETELAVCELVEEHTKELFKLTPVASETLEFLFTSPDIPESPITSSILLLISHLRLPIPDLRMRVLRELTFLAIEKPDLVLPFVQDGLKQDIDTQDHLLALCEALANDNNIALKAITDDIRSLSFSSDFGIAERARKILRLCGENVPTNNPKIALSPTPILGARIHLPSRIEESSGHLLGHSDAERIKPYGLQAHFLARFAGVDKETVLRLCAQQLDTLGLTPQILEEQDKLLQSRSSGVRLSYLRPRVLAAFRAVSHIATQLRQRGNLSDQEANELFNLCMNRYDPAMLTRHPESQPREIAAHGIGDYASRESWVQQLANARGGDICQAVDEQGWIILAERIKIDSVRYESWEYRQTGTFIPLPGMLLNERLNLEDPFLRKMGGTISNYADESWQQPDDGLVRLIAQPRAEWIETFENDWLSLRPDLAKHLGWHSLQDDLLSWSDSQGNVIVKSFGWQNGIKDHADLSDLKSGWRVLISPAGWNQLLRELPGVAYRAIEIQRGFAREYESRSKNRWIDKLP